MAVFELKSQEEIDEKYQGINLSKFKFSDNKNDSEEELIDDFIHSKSFTEESCREIIKNHTGEIPFLRQAFEIDLVKIKDLKNSIKRVSFNF